VWTLLVRPNYYGAYGFYPAPRFGHRYSGHLLGLSRLATLVIFLGLRPPFSEERGAPQQTIVKKKICRPLETKIRFFYFSLASQDSSRAPDGPGI
jgi:hypothetical protein